MAFSAVAALAILGKADPTAMAQRAPTVAQDAGASLTTVSFATLEGTVRVYLPRDLQAGDTISGTVSLEPSGKSDREKQRNLATLQGLVVEVGRERISASRPAWTTQVPATAEGAVALALRSSKGTVGATRVPLAEVTGRPVSGFSLPVLGQAGQPLRVAGPCDGRFETGGLRIGTAPAERLAESPRGAVFRSPADVVGLVELQFEEGGQRVTGGYRSVGIELSAPRLNLDRGQQTTLTVEVRGLEGLTAPVTFEVRNASPAVVELEGGTQQPVTIAPAEVAPGGVYCWVRRLTGVGVGNFDLHAELEIPPGTSPQQPAGDSIQFQAAPAEPETELPETQCGCSSLTVAGPAKKLDAKLEFPEKPYKVKATLPLKWTIACARTAGRTPPENPICAGKTTVEFTDGGWAAQNQGGAGWFQRGKSSEGKTTMTVTSDCGRDPPEMSTSRTLTYELEYTASAKVDRGWIKAKVTTECAGPRAEKIFEFKIKGGSKDDKASDLDGDGNPDQG